MSFIRPGKPPEKHVQGHYAEKKKDIEGRKKANIEDQQTDHYEFTRTNTVGFSMFGPRRLPFVGVNPSPLPKSLKVMAALISEEERSAEQCYLSRKPIVFNKELRDAAKVTVRDELSTAKRHIALVTGEGDCIGTGQVAAWLAESIRSYLKSSEFLRNTTLNTNRVEEVRKKMWSFVDVLKDIDRFRQQIQALDQRLYDFSVLEGHSFDLNNLKRQKANTIGYAILQHVRTFGKCLIPVDFHGYSAYFSGEICGHSTSLLIERANQTSNDLLLRLFETNGAFTAVLKKSSVKRMRTDAHGIERKGMAFGPSDFTLDDIDYTSRGEDIGTARTMCQRVVTRSFDSLSFSGKGPESIMQARKDCAIISRIIYLSAHFQLGSLQEMADTLEDCFSSIGPSFLPKQRLHAVQGTKSCELKSLTVVAAHLFQDEVAYQALIVALSNQALKTAMGLSDKTGVNLGLAHSTVEDAQKRLEHAMRFEN